MPVGRSEGYLPQIGEGFEALDPQTVARDKLDGFAVVNGLKVTTDGTDLTLDVGQSAGGGTATVGESSGTVQTVSLGSAGTVTLDAADSTNPRKDTIYIDTNGDLQAETGTAESALPSGNDRFTTFQPESPLPSTEGTVLARVWVGAGVTSIQSADIDDLRVPADTVADDVTARSVSTEEADITGETYIEASLSADKTGLSSGSWTYAFDQEDEDNLNEFDPANGFTPSETGKYQMLGYASISPGSDGDLLQSEIAKSNGTRVSLIDSKEVGGASNRSTIGLNWTGTLQSGTTYQPRVRDTDSSFDIVTNETQVVIARKVVHP